MSLPVQHRLRHRRDFSKVYRHGLRCSSQHLALRALKGATPANRKNRCRNDGKSENLLHRAIAPIDGDRPNQHHGISSYSSAEPHGRKANTSGKCPTCVGISISQKVSKKAVVRNRIKRQIKAAVRHLLPQIQSGWLLVVIVRPSAIQCDYWQFLRELEQMLRKIEVIDGHS